VLRLLVLGLPLVAAAVAACSAPATIRIDRIDHATQFAQNGPDAKRTIYWSGEPRLPADGPP
jgi:hypothetical protein